MQNIDTNIENISTEEKVGVYEVGFHLLPTLDGRGIEKGFEAIKKVVSDNGGVFVTEGVPEMTELAYDMSKNIGGVNKKFDKSYFGWVKFELESIKVENINQSLKAMDSVLRFLLVSTVKENTMYTKKSPLARKENELVQTEDIDKSIEELVIN